METVWFCLVALMVAAYVVLDDPLGGAQVGVEERLGPPGDGLGDQRGEADDVRPELLELLGVELAALFGIFDRHGATHGVILTVSRDAMRGRRERVTARSSALHWLAIFWSAPRQTRSLASRGSFDVHEEDART